MLVVLLPIDFSDHAANASHYACNLLKYTRCRFIVCHAAHHLLTRINPGDEINADHPGSANLLEARKKLLNEFARNLERKYANPRHTFEPLLLKEPIQNSLPDKVASYQADLVVMGTKGRKNRREETFGSNTLLAMKQLDCPVISVPADFSYQSPRNILFATDFKVVYKRRELKLLCELAGSYRATIELLYLSDNEDLSEDQQSNKRFLEESLHKAHIELEILPGTNKAAVIRDVIEKKGIQLLAMVNTHHGLVERFIEKFTIDQLGLRLEIPFLVMQNLER